MIFKESVLYDAEGNPISPETYTETIYASSGTTLADILSSLMQNINTVLNKANANENKINILNQNTGGVKRWYGTQEQFDKISPKDANTEYNIY